MCDCFSLCNLIFFLFQVSPNNKFVAYAEDTKGDEIFTVHVIDIESRTPVGMPLVGVTSDLEWAGDEALVYTTRDEILRPDKVWSMDLVIFLRRVSYLVAHKIFSPFFSH